MIHSLAVCFLRAIRCGEFKVGTEIIEAFRSGHVPDTAALHTGGISALQVFFLIRSQPIKSCSNGVCVNSIPEDFEHVGVFLIGDFFHNIPTFISFFVGNIKGLAAVQALCFPEIPIRCFLAALIFLHEGFQSILQIVLHPCGGADFFVSGYRWQ